MLAAARNLKLHSGILFFGLWIASESLVLAQGAVIGLRGGEAEAALLASDLRVPLIGTDAKEFENGNTYVRLLAPVAGQDIIVPLLGTMSADSTMEALILVRTAKTSGARTVTVRTSRSLASIRVLGSKGTPIEMNLEPLFNIAGADYVDEVNTPLRSPMPMVPLRSNARADQVSIVNINHPALARQLSETLGFPMSEADALAGQGAQALLIWSSVTPVNAGFLELLSAANTVSSRGVTAHAVLAYLPYARSDKVDTEGVTVSGRLAADLIEASGVAAATFVRPHAPQSQGFFRIPTTTLSSRPTLIKILKTMGVDALVASDSGAAKSTHEVAKEWGSLIPVGVASKERDATTGKSTFRGLSGLDPRGRVVAILDDEIASGSTGADNADFVKGSGARETYLVVTHLAGPATKAIESRAIDRIVVTDTIPPPAGLSDKVVVVSIAAEIAASLRKTLVRDRILAASCDDLFQRLKELPR